MGSDPHRGVRDGRRPAVLPVAFHLPVTAVLVAAVGMTLSVDPARLPAAAVAGPAMMVMNLVATIMSVLVCRRSDLDERTRTAWRWLTAAAALRLAGSVLFAAFASFHVFPAPGDLARLVMVPVMLVGLLKLPRRRTGPTEGTRLAFDVAAVFLGGAMLVWYLAVGPALTAHGVLSVDELAAAVFYPVGDLILFFGVAVVAVQGLDPGTGRMARLTIVALLFEVVGDAYLSYAAAHGNQAQWASWQFACWTVGHGLFAMAVFEQYRPGRRPQPPGGGGTASSHGGPTVSRLPYLGTAVGVVLLVVAAIRQGDVYPWLGLVLGSIGTTVIVVGRQATVLRENYQLAVTDGLTGLANRGELHAQLADALLRARRAGQTVAVLLADLNGFKQINDTLGHAAGDQMLVAFAGMMRRSVLGADVVGRLGGDEFAIVLRDIGSAGNAEAVIHRLREEMTLPLMLGDVVVEVRAAIGYALAGPDDDTDSLLRRADAAMYRVKREADPARP